MHGRGSQAQQTHRDPALQRLTIYPDCLHGKKIAVRGSTIDLNCLKTMQKDEKNNGPNDNEQEIEPGSTDIKAGTGEQADEKAERSDNSEGQGNELEKSLKEANDKYLRLYSEYDNYRRRTLKERSELLKTASEEVLKAVIPVLDDLERAIKANEQATDINSVKEGIQLIYNKLKNTVQQKGLVSFESAGMPFDPDKMEAITHLPATEEAKKGTVVDEVEKGYKLGDKIIRFAKVVVAQ
jgi:molecular chaperone GrpE